MKKIVCLALAIMMLVSVAPMAFAANVDYSNGTDVSYTGQGSESYTVTVPALLAPGESGDVILNGTWASNRVVTVGAATQVVLTNSINAQDTKTLAVTFDGIEQVGDNNNAIANVTETVSVAAITNALFGTWSGEFTYTVAIDDVVTEG